MYCSAVYTHFVCQDLLTGRPLFILGATVTLILNHKLNHNTFSYERFVVSSHKGIHDVLALDLF